VADKIYGICSSKIQERREGVAAIRKDKSDLAEF